MNYLHNFFEKNIQVLFIISIFTCLVQMQGIPICTVFNFIFFVISCVLICFFIVNIQKDYLFYSIFFLLIINVTTNACFSKYKIDINFSYLIKLISYLTTVFYIKLADVFIFNVKTIDFIKKSSLFFAVAFIVTFFTNHICVSDYLILGFDNPNTTGAILLLAILLLYNYYNNKINTFMKILSLLMLVFLCYMLLQTGARSAMAGVSFVIIMSLLGKVNKNYKLNKFFIIFIVLIPIILFLFFKIIKTNPWFVDLFDFAVSEGKSINSRDDIWEFGLSFFKQSIFFGSYSEISEGTGLSQLHNFSLDFMISFGLIPFILFYLFLIRVLIKINKNITNFNQYLGLCSFLGCLVQGYFESGLLVAPSWNLLAISLLFIIKYENGELSEDINN